MAMLQVYPSFLLDCDLAGKGDLGQKIWSPKPKATKGEQTDNQRISSVNEDYRPKSQFYDFKRYFGL
jgi:hypothetical protein